MTDSALDLQGALDHIGRARLLAQDLTRSMRPDNLMQAQAGMLQELDEAVEALTGRVRATGIPRAARTSSGEIRKQSWAGQVLKALLEGPATDGVITERLLLDDASRPMVRLARAGLSDEGLVDVHVTDKDEQVITRWHLTRTGRDVAARMFPGVAREKTEDDHPQLW